MWKIAMTRFLLVACDTEKWSPTPTCFGSWENASAGIVCLADRQAEGVSWWGNQVQKTLAGGCAMQANLNFQANTQVSLLCSIAVGLTHSFLFLFNLASPTNANREGCFHLLWKIHRSQGVWLRRLSGNEEHRKCCRSRSCEFAGPVSCAQPSSAELSLGSALRCGLCCAAVAHRSSCVFWKLVFAHLRGARCSARLQQTEGQKSSLWTTLIKSCSCRQAVLGKIGLGD